MAQAMEIKYKYKIKTCAFFWTNQMIFFAHGVELTEFWWNMSALLKPALDLPRILSLSKDLKIILFWLVFEGAVVADKRS